MLLARMQARKRHERLSVALGPAPQPSGLAGWAGTAGTVQKQKTKDDEAAKRVETAADVAAEVTASLISIPRLSDNEVVQVVREGRLVTLHSGRCDITATLAIQGTNVITRQAHLELPGIIPLGPGIRLLPVRNYLIGAEQAKAPMRTSPSGQPPGVRTPFALEHYTVDQLITLMLQPNGTRFGNDPLATFASCRTPGRAGSG